MPEDDPRRGDAAEAAEYIGVNIANLAHIARRHGLEMLGYLLDMALLETHGIVKRSADARPSPDPSEEDAIRSM